MSNTQDVMQTRKPNGNYFHGASYGNDGDYNGGPDNLQVCNSCGSDNCFYFSGTDIRDVGNWNEGDATANTGTTDETPGSANNSANATFIENLKCSTLPIELLTFEGTALEKRNRIHWRTASESHHDRFEVQRSRNAKDFRTIRTLNGKGVHGTVAGYEVHDEEAPSLAYYRLKSVDLDGTVEYSRTIALHRDPASGMMKLKERGGTYRVALPEAAPSAKLKVYDAMGRKVKTLDASGTSEVRFDLNGTENGLYFIHYRRPDGLPLTQKFFH
jgi:hypothetical protein